MQEITAIDRNTRAGQPTGISFGVAMRYAVWGLILPAALWAQGHNYTQADVDAGAVLYRSNCIGCHGPDGNLVTGIDLGHAQFRRVSTDEEIVNVILKGVPNTGMPGLAVTPTRAVAIVAYIRSLGSPTAMKSIAAPNGDPMRGKSLFRGKAACITCHRVWGEGGRSGPDLTEAGLSLRAIEVETSILNPSAGFSANNRIYRALKKDGTRVAGRLLNQDAYSLNMSDSSGNLVTLFKADLDPNDSGFVNESPMPSYRGKLDAQELADVIVYVESLRGVVK
jgi:putative heme-binding domain-containing protein